MNTRTIVSTLLLGCLACAGALAEASEFSMGGEMSSDALGSPASAGVATMDSVSRTGGGDATFYAQGGSETPADEPTVTRAPTEADTTPTPAATGPARATTTGAAPASATRARNGNRWQSLVPGAIK